MLNDPTSTTTQFDPVLTNEAAQILAKSPATIREWERRGILRAIKTAGGVRLFDRRDVERLARDRQAGAEAQ